MFAAGERPHPSREGVVLEAGCCMHARAHVWICVCMDCMCVSVCMCACVYVCACVARVLRVRDCARGGGKASGLFSKQVEQTGDSARGKVLVR